ncbi:peroxisomal membrane protein PMP34-like [Anneissia japonica]|uniref:peroxisomal membrane protein PMP34-like n=1 Tax=Anneissia japonica TaxID=1529436 RepID=UPI0014257EE1|nr:peroxisomal membrane protein PMP34-like [Anneissia japonica]
MSGAKVLFTYLLKDFFFYTYRDDMGDVTENVGSKLFTYKTLVHAIAGAAGSVTAITVFFPLDTARLRLQVDDQRQAKSTPHIICEILKQEGYTSLYKGWFPVISSLCCSNFVYFYCFQGLQAKYVQTLPQHKAFKDLIFGIIAGVLNVLVTTPMWVVNTRLKLQGVKFKSEISNKPSYYKGILDAFKKIIKDEGFWSLWNGTMSSLMLVGNPAIQFMVYQTLKRWRQGASHSMELGNVTYFLIGAVAKAVATVLTYPLQVVQSKQRFSNQGNKKDVPTKTVDLLKHIIRTHGFRHLYKGLETKLIQTVLTAALMFLTYERIAATVFRIMRLENALKKTE